MTVLTKPFEEKKNEKLLPFPGGTGAVGAEGASFTPNAPDDPERGSNVLLIDQNPRRMSKSATIFLFLSALGIMCIGIIAGVGIYRAYGRSQLRFHGFCGVPYNANIADNDAMIYMNNKWRDEWKNQPRADQLSFLNNLEDKIQHLYNDSLSQNFFKEEFELDLTDDEEYTKIDVPDFRDGRNGRFLHDFKLNQSAIIDTDTGRCFVMPLDRETILPPKSMYDLVIKMWSGFYNINTDVIRKKMRVVTPAVTDMSSIAPRIAAECEDMKIYMLEKYVSGVYKRSIVNLDQHGKFAEFSGVSIVTYDFVNINEVDNLERIESSVH